MRKVAEPTRSEDVEPDHVAGWFREAIERGAVPDAAQCGSLARYIRGCTAPLSPYPSDPKAGQAAERIDLASEPTRKAIKRVIKAINEKIVERQEDLKGQPRSRYAPLIKADIGRLSRLREDLTTSSIDLCGGLHRRKHHRDAAWHSRANVLSSKVRDALAAAGRKQISMNPTSPLVAVTRRALEITEKREFTEEEVASALRRMPAEQARRKARAK